MGGREWKLKCGAHKDHIDAENVQIVFESIKQINTEDMFTGNSKCGYPLCALNKKLYMDSEISSTAMTDITYVYWRIKHFVKHIINTKRMKGISAA